MLDLAFSPDRSRDEPVYRQLELYLSELIRTRRLAPGERLPASRELAASLRLSRNTVSQAYQALIDQGLLRAHVGQGTFVAGRVEAKAPRLAPELPPRALAWEGLLARRARQASPPRGLLTQAGPRHIEFDCRAGRVDVSQFPLAGWKRASAAALERMSALADAVDPRGYAPLRQAVASSLLARGIQCDPDEIAIVNGAQQAFDLVARALIDPGDSVVIEQPGWFGAASVFRACEAHLLGVGVDAEGLRTDELARILRARRVKLLFTTPAVQSPTGVVLAPARRAELLALADDYQLAVVEDDYDSEMRYGAPAPALKTLDRAGQVIYAGTFSKALFPGLRVGYLVAPRALSTRFMLLRYAMDVHTPTLVQATLAELFASGAFERHVRRVRALYAERRDALCAALTHHMPDGVRFAPPAGGNTLWIELPAEADVALVHSGCAQRGIALHSGSPFAFEGSEAAAACDRHLVVSFANLDVSQAEACAARLADAVRRALPARRRRSA